MHAIQSTAFGNWLRCMGEGKEEEDSVVLLICVYDAAARWWKDAWSPSVQTIQAIDANSCGQTKLDQSHLQEKLQGMEGTAWCCDCTGDVQFYRLQGGSRLLPLPLNCTWHPT